MIDDLPRIKKDEFIKKDNKKGIVYDKIRNSFIIVNRENLPPLSSIGASSYVIDHPAMAINLYEYFDDEAKAVISDYYENYKLSYAVKLPRGVKLHVNLPEGKELHEHQKVGVYYIEKMHQKQKGVLIADEMGLGKTIQVIAYINRHLAEYKRILIISPAIMKIKWLDEIVEWIFYDKNKINIVPADYGISYENIDKTYSTSILEEHENDLLNIYIVEPTLKIMKNNSFLNDTGIFIVGDTNLHHLFRDVKELEKSYNAFNKKKRNKSEYVNFVKSLSSYMVCDPFDLVVIDEAHILRTDSRRSILGTILALSSANFILLTGTPIFNNLFETYKLASILNLESKDDLYLSDVKELLLSLGAEEKFDEKNKIKYIDDKKPYVRKNFGNLLRMTGMLRRTVKDVFPNFVKKTTRFIPVDSKGISPDVFKQEDKTIAAKIIKQIYDKTIKYVEDLVESKGKYGTKYYDIESRLMSYLMLTIKEKDKYLDVKLIPKTIQEFSRYKQVAGIEKAKIITSQTDDFGDIIDFYVNTNREKLVLFIHHQEVKRILIDYLVRKRIKYVTITGEEDFKEKSDNVKLFNNDVDYKVALCSIYASSVGIDLVSSKHAIFVEIDWTPANLLQAEARIYRIGQTQDVIIDYLVLKNTIDEKISKIVIEKKKMMEETLRVNEQKTSRINKIIHDKINTTNVINEFIEEDILKDKKLNKKVNSKKLKNFMNIRKYLKERFDTFINTKIQFYKENNKNIAKIVGYVEKEKLPYYIAVAYVLSRKFDEGKSLSSLEVREYDYILAEYLLQNAEAFFS